MESFSDDEDCKAIETKNNSKTENLTNSKNSLFLNESIDIDSNFNKNDSAAEIRRLLRKKDELERKQKMQDKFDKRLKVSRFFFIDIRGLFSKYLNIIFFQRIDFYFIFIDI